MPVTRRQRTAGNCKPVFGRSLKEFQGGPPQLFRDLLVELKRFLATETLFTKAESPEKLNLMRKAWDMGKDPLMVMRSSAHALASALMLWLDCLPEPLLASELSNILLQATNICEGAERLHVLQQVFSHIDRTSLQVLYPLVELLHHHRLNISQPDSLPATFAPLLLPEVSAQPSMWDNTAAREALTDIVITNYRTIFAGALPSSFTATAPEAPVSGSAPPQKGVFGGHDAVDALFGRGRSASADAEPNSDCADHMDSHHCGMAIDEAAGADAAVPAGWPRKDRPEHEGEDGVVPEVQAEVERLLSGSLDSTLFAEDDSLFAARCEQSFALPALLSARSFSCRSDVSDDSDGDVSSQLAKNQQLSPTSHVPEQLFRSPLVQDVHAHGSFMYLHAEIYAAMHLHAAALDSQAAHCWAGSPFVGPAEAADARAEACQEHVLQKSLMELGAWDSAHHDTPMKQIDHHLLPKSASGGRFHIPTASC